MKTIPAKTILTKTKRENLAWFAYDYTMNLYRGCCHGCIYCDSRSDCYHVENFDEVCAKENAIQLLEKELNSKRQTGVVATGAMTDPYNPFENTAKLTRKALELLYEYQFGVSIATKSDLIIRDIDLLQYIKKHSPVLAKLTITTADDTLAKKIEPHVSSSTERFTALEQLAKANIFCGVLLMPVLPFLEDSAENIEQIVKKTAESGANFIYADFGVTMRAGQREYFLLQLAKLFPEEKLSEKYISRYGYRYHCSSPQYKKLWNVFSENCQKYGLLYTMPDIIRGYRQGYKNPQLSFFD